MKKLTPWPSAEDVEQDVLQLDALGLKQYLKDLQQWIAWMDEREPEDEESEEYEAWADTHEALEDLLDEALDALEG